MKYCAAECQLCGDVVVATSPTQPSICSCKEVSITGNEYSSAARYKTQTPKAFQIETEQPITSGVILKGSDIKYQRI